MMEDFETLYCEAMCNNHLERNGVVVVDGEMAPWDDCESYCPVFEGCPLIKQQEAS